VDNVVTLTVKSEGIRGNLYILHQDDTDLPSGITSAIAGGTAVTGGAVPFTDGAGTEDVTTLLTSIYSGRYHRIAIAQIDTTNLPLWKTHINLKAGPLENRMQHVVLATNGTQSAATTLSTGTINDPRFQHVWLKNSETHPSRLAAAMAALRASKAPSQPNVGFDGDELVGVAPQAYVADWPQMSVQQSCLDNGVTPLATQPDGTVVVVRAITTKCLDGANYNYETLDVGTAETPDYVRDNLSLIWHQEFKVANPYVADDPPEGAKPRPAGIATPTLWKERVRGFLKTLEERENPILIDVDQNPPRAEYNSAAKRIMSAVPVKDAPVQHQIGVSVRQLS
jgi:phage tail sheath gpL-like